MNIKVIYSSGGKYNKETQQKIADDYTPIDAKRIVDALQVSGHAAEAYKITPSKINNVKNINADAVFNLCEWSGRDYPLGVNVLKALEEVNLPYTGGDSKSYEWCCDKITMKQMFDEYKIPTPPWQAINLKDSEKIIIEKISKLKLPVIIKPAYEHCAIGINRRSVAHSRKNLAKKIKKLLKQFKQPLLVEEFISGREFNVTVIKNHRLHIFPPTEIVFKNYHRDKMMSFNTKWINTEDDYSLKIIKDEAEKKFLKYISKKIFLKMNCKGYVRIDMRAKGKKIYILEVNINPDITPYSSYALTVSMEAYGWSFNKMVDEIANAAVASSNA